ncbi:reverse transcriptase domain-containing protein [Tanacetum coccineum]
MIFVSCTLILPGGPPGSSLSTLGFILGVWVRSIYISPPPYLASAGLGCFGDVCKVKRPSQWCPPDDRSLKLNVDSSEKGKPGLVGIDGLLRNIKGVVLALFSAPFSVMDSNVVEVLAIKEACKMLNKKGGVQLFEPELRTIVAPMAERTMEELLRAPTEGYGEAIVLPEINADHFEIKTKLLQLVQANPFHGLENKNPHAHINSFKRITSTLRFRNVPNDVIKLMMFPYSLEGAAKTWYEKEPPNSILTWEDLVRIYVFLS